MMGGSGAGGEDGCVGATFMSNYIFPIMQKGMLRISDSLNFGSLVPFSTWRRGQVPIMVLFPGCYLEKRI